MKHENKTTPLPVQVVPRPVKSLRLPIVIAIIAVILVASSGGVVIWQLNGKKLKSGDKATVTELVKDLKDSKVTTTPVNVNVSSSLGFVVTYDPDSLQAKGQTTDPASADGYVYGESFEGDDLKNERPYSMVKFTQQNSSTLIDPEISISTNIRSAFWDRFSGEPDFENRKLDILTENMIKSRTESDIDVTASEIKSVNINGIEYSHVVLSRNNEKYGIGHASQSQLYITVQNGRPYWVTVDNTVGNSALEETFNAVLASISYIKPDSSKLGMTDANATFVSVDLPEDTSNLPDDIDTDTVIPVILQNQPAVVRILSIRCGSVVLSSGDSKVELPRGCNGGVGSGSFISSDGYIATNGHVVTVTESQLIAASIDSMEAVQKVVEFMVKTGSMTEEQGKTFVEALQKNDPSAQSALAQLPQAIAPSMVSVKDDSYQYGIQTSNQPIRTRDMNISYDETILEAKLVDADYDAYTADKALQGEGDFTTSDVAILKTKGSFPTVKLASGGSLQKSDKITAIGYPAFVDDSISTSQWQTVPTITQGRVTAVYSDNSYGGRIVGTSVKAAPGNSGGPAFNLDGEQGGLVTYSSMSCPDKNCFGNGSLRDIEDIYKLIKKNNIALKQSKITDEWTEGLAAFADGNYQKALGHFDTVKREYPANYLAPELSRVARAKLGSETDTSNSSISIVLTVAISVIAIGLITIIILVIVMVRTMRARRRQIPQMY